MSRTFVAKETETEKKWYVVDADGKVLGRLAAEIAKRLRGKHKPVFTPHADTGDFVIVVNAEKVRLTGGKLDQKMYYRYSGYIGGLKQISARKQLEKKPEELLRHAIKGMLPKNSLGRRQFKKLKVYAGPDHPHQAQQPESLEI
ncbi:MAG: 50S ribosomal protein L13 [Deltaproteobacteria bacterium]|nr:50S ribosomal protein L13 [Deltaproteobacteria bacterium]